jgi:tripartite-type tricarboxylate transporter receptor subunit TctC
MIAIRLLLTAVLALASAAAQAQTFPAKPIRLVSPFPAGGPNDAAARIAARAMQARLGQTVVVENIGGAGGTIGMARVSAAAPDGYTIAVWHIAQATAPSLYPSLKYDVVNDFDHLGRITDVPMTLVSKNGIPATNVTEVIAWMQKENDKASYGHAGIGSASHLCMLMLSKELKIQPRGIGYRGTGPAMNDLLGGQFDIMCDQTTNTTNQINSGTIRGYAVTTKAKVSSLPNLPTLDSGPIKGFEVAAWHALWAPKGLPKDVTDKLVNALQVALKDQKVIERMASLGIVPVPMEQATPDALKAHLAAEVPRWGEVIKAAGAKGE